MNKKSFRPIISILIFLAVVCLFGCENSGAPISTDPQDFTEAPAVTESPAPADFQIFADEKYTCTLVLADNYPSVDYQVAKELMISLFSKTRVTINFVKESELKNSDGNLILLGNTAFSQSQTTYAALGKRCTEVKLIENRLVIAFDNLASGLAAVEDLVSAMTLSQDGKLTLPADYLFTHTALPNADELPEYSATATSMSCGEGTNMIQSESSPEKFAEYCKKLEDIGFNLVRTHEQSGNTFKTFLGETDYIYLYFSSYNNEIRILSGPAESLAAEDYSSSLPETYTSYLASIPQPDNGLGYIFRLPDGRFIIFDGGYSGEDRVYATLRQLLPEGEIVIAAWVISHPHGDHQGAFIDFIKSHNKDADITIERVMFNFTANKEYTVNNSERQEDNSEDANRLRKAISNYIPNIPVIKLHTGQIIKFGSVELEVLYTVEDIMPRDLPNVNDSSLTVRINTPTDSILILADTCYDSGPMMVELWGEYLETNILQVAHHGQWPSEKELYHAIKAKTLLFPAVRYRLKEYLLIKEGADSIKAAMSYATDIHFSGDSLEIIRLPYVTLNNKDQMLKELNPDLVP